MDNNSDTTSRTPAEEDDEDGLEEEIPENLSVAETLTLLCHRIKLLHDQPELQLKEIRHLESYTSHDLQDLGLTQELLKYDILPFLLDLLIGSSDQNKPRYHAKLAEVIFYIFYQVSSEVTTPYLIKMNFLQTLIFFLLRYPAANYSNRTLDDIIDCLTILVGASSESRDIFLREPNIHKFLISLFVDRPDTQVNILELIKCTIIDPPEVENIELIQPFFDFITKLFHSTHLLGPVLSATFECLEAASKHERFDDTVIKPLFPSLLTLFNSNSKKSSCSISIVGNLLERKSKLITRKDRKTIISNLYMIIEDSSSNFSRQVEASGALGKLPEFYEQFSIIPSFDHEPSLRMVEILITIVITGKNKHTLNILIKNHLFVILCEACLHQRTRPKAYEALMRLSDVKYEELRSLYPERLDQWNLDNLYGRNFEYFWSLKNARVSDNLILFLLYLGGNPLQIPERKFALYIGNDETEQGQGRSDEEGLFQWSFLIFAKHLRPLTYEMIQPILIIHYFCLQTLAHYPKRFRLPIEVLKHLKTFLYKPIPSIE